MAVNLTVRQVDKETLLREMDLVLSDLLGPKAYGAIVAQLGSQFSFHRDDILERPTEFENALEKLMGRAAPVVLRTVLRRWFEMIGLDPPSGMSLSEAVERIIRLSNSMSS
jgi:hypothetical protein